MIEGVTDPGGDRPLDVTAGAEERVESHEEMNEAFEAVGHDGVVNEVARSCGALSLLGSSALVLGIPSSQLIE